MTLTALSINKLHKSFDRPAVNGLDLTIEAGEFYALLGPNGAGKTTTLRMVAGLLKQDEGEISIFGHSTTDDPFLAKSVTAWVPDDPMIYDRLTPLENLEFVAGLWDMEPQLAEREAHHLLDWLKLTPHAHERCGGFSKGMRQKVALACALIHDPKLIILDEPLTGLDAGSSRLVKAVLKERTQRGCSVVMTTHILEVAERMAERIGIISRGRVIASGTLEELGKMPKPVAGTNTAGRNGGQYHNGANGKNGSASLEDIFLDLVENAETSPDVHYSGEHA